MLYDVYLYLYQEALDRLVSWRDVVRCRPWRRLEAALMLTATPIAGSEHATAHIQRQRLCALPLRFYGNLALLGKLGHRTTYSEQLFRVAGLRLFAKINCGLLSICPLSLSFSPSSSSFPFSFRVNKEAKQDPDIKIESNFNASLNIRQGSVKGKNVRRDTNSTMSRRRYGTVPAVGRSSRGESSGPGKQRTWRGVRKTRIDSVGIRHRRKKPKKKEEEWGRDNTIERHRRQEVRWLAGRAGTTIGIVSKAAYWVPWPTIDLVQGRCGSPREASAHFGKVRRGTTELAWRVGIGRRQRRRQARQR